MTWTLNHYHNLNRKQKKESGEPIGQQLKQPNLQHSAVKTQKFWMLNYLVAGRKHGNVTADQEQALWKKITDIINGCVRMHVENQNSFLVNIKICLN